MASEQDNPPDIVQETITDDINEHLEVQGDVSLERNEPLETSNSTGDAEREIRTDAAEPIDFIEPNTDSKEPELETPLKIVETSKEKQETTTEKQAANNDFELPDKVLKEIQALTATKQPTARDIGPNMFKLFHSFGFQSHKRSNLHFLNEQIVLSSIGNLIVFLDLKSGTMEYVKAPRDGSIGSIAVHPTKNYFAVGEVVEENPFIYIYKYPSLEIIRVLKGGADRGYADLCFNAKGNKLASVASDPDYMLTVWSWKDSAILLRSKAFSQDVYRISFAPDNDGILTSSGMGHIKFWRMSATFTGLKLQGYIGKFGASELTDIASFIQLPDGKVLSSTETGNLLLWDGGMIKCEIGVKGKKPCHQGKIEVILLGENEIITGGEDGYFRVWDLETIDNADVQSSNEGTGSSAAVPRVFEMQPIDEILVSKDVKIKNIVRYPSQTDFLIQDQQGQLLKLDMNKRVSEKIMSFHSGSVMGLDFSPVYHQMATLGIGGNLRIYDYMQKQVVHKTLFPQGGSCLYYLPTILDSYGSTIVAGFADGVIRFVSAIPSGFVLHYVFKPHKSNVTLICFSQDGTKMVTTSSDGTIFLFQLTNKKQGSNAAFSKNSVVVSPIGFLTLEAQAHHVSFAQDYEMIQTKKKPMNGLKLYITTKNGTMYTARIPAEADYDTTASFELDPSLVQLTKWSVKVTEKVAAVVEQEQTDENASGSQTNLAAAPQELLTSKAMLSMSLNSLRKAKGLLLKADARISAVLGLKDDYTIMAVKNDDDECEIRLINTTTPEKSELLLVTKESVSVMQYDQTKQSILIGTMSGGSIIVRFQLERFLKYNGEMCTDHQSYSEYMEALESRTEKIIKEIEAEHPDFRQNPQFDVIVDCQSWTGHLHDITQGRITSFTSTFDASYFATSGTDGGIFLWRNAGAEIERNNVFDSELPDLLSSVSQPEDIVEASAYSIQEAKLKSEKDRELETAEEKKQVLRGKIQDLRNEFNRVMNENENAPEHVKLNRSELSVDPFLKEDIEKEAKLKKETLLKELAWTAERDAIGAAKLKKKFLDPLKSERIQISSFNDGSKVESFRTLNLDAYTEPLLAQLLSSTEQSANRDILIETEKVQNRDERIGDVEGNSSNQKKAQKVPVASKLEERKQLRAERAAQWKALMEAKPDDKYEDPRDLAAIKSAIANMGDYKLKTADNYIVPENERVDADKKKRQIILLNDSIKSLKDQFNAKVFSLRDSKVRIIQQFHDNVNRIKEINEELVTLGESVDVVPEPPTLETGLYPEDREKVTPQDIEELLKEEQVQSTKRGKDDGLGFGNSPAVVPKEKPVSSKKDVKIAMQEVIAPVAVAVPSTPSKQGAAKTDFASKQAELEKIELTVHRLQLKYEKNRLIETLQENITQFDKAIALLSKERMLLAADLKFAEIKLHVLFREWVLLKEFEHTDNSLSEKLNSKKGEKKEIEVKIGEYRDKLLTKKGEIDGIIRQEKVILEEYRSLIGENNKNEEFLTKIFKRKVKRVKKKTDDGETEKENEEEDYESDDSSYNSEDEEENDDLQEVIPADCDPNIWKGILALREKRLDVEEVLQEVQKNVELLKRENDALLKKEKVIDSGLKSTETEIQEFQSLKQRKLNELDVVVPLRLNQIQYLEENKIPTDMTHALVFYNEGLAQLKRRIKELQQEKLDIKKQHRELKKQHVMYNKSKKEKQARVAELQEKARDVQMLKFGQIVDLEKLERLGSNKAAEELKDKLQKEELKRAREIASLEKQIREEKTSLMTVMQENTLCLERIVLLQDQKQNVERGLNAAQKSVNAEISGPAEKETEEREKLMVLVQDQAKQIELIKAEIENLIRKPTNKTYRYTNNPQPVAYADPVPPPAEQPSQTSVFQEEVEIPLD